MCRFNLILIKEECAEKLLLQEEYCKFYDDLCGFKAYQKGYCNCGSFVGSFVEKKGTPYQLGIEEARKEKLERLKQIKEIMLQPDYEIKKEEFEAISEHYTKLLDTFYQHIHDYEREQINFIEKEYSGDEMQLQYDMMYQQISNKFLDIEKQPEFVKVQSEYHNHRQQNDLLQESLLYCLTEEANPLIPGIPLKEFLDSEYDMSSVDLEVINIPIESNVIDEVITRTENDTNAEKLEEYHSYYKTFTNLLKEVPSIRFGTIWSDSNSMKLVKTVDINSLLIDDLAVLGYDEMICITK